MRNKITAALILLFFSLFLAFPVFAESNPQFSLQSEAAVLMEARTGQVLFSSNSENKLAPASLTKLMTLLLSFEAIAEGRVHWDDEVIISEKAWRTGGSQMFLNLDQKVPFLQLVQGIATISANDACVAVSEHLCGDEALFVKKMNQKAGEIGLKHTQFHNASGLDAPGQVTTAMDIALLAQHIISSFPEMLDFFSMESYAFNGIEQKTRNPLLGRYPGADGLKTGFTQEAGYCLAGTAEQSGLRFITIILNAPSERARLEDTETMLNYAFRNYQLKKVLLAEEPVAQITVQKGQEPTVMVAPKTDVEVLVPFEIANLETNVQIPQEVGPIEKGESLGVIQILLDDQVLEEVELVAVQNVDEITGLAAFWHIISQLAKNLWTSITEKIGSLLGSLILTK